MRAGGLRHLIAIDQPVVMKDVDGDPVTVWTIYADKVPAQIDPLSARELMAAAATQSEVTARITIRWMGGLKASMRIRDLERPGVFYDIDGVIDDNRSGREWITIPAQTGVGVYNSELPSALDGGSPGIEPDISVDGGSP